MHKGERVQTEQLADGVIALQRAEVGQKNSAALTDASALGDAIRALAKGAFGHKIPTYEGEVEPTPGETTDIFKGIL